MSGVSVDFTDAARTARLEVYALVRAALHGDADAYAALAPAEPVSAALLEQYRALVALARDLIASLDHPDAFLDQMAAAVIESA